MAKSEVSEAQRSRIFERDDFTCVACGGEYPPPSFFDDVFAEIQNGGNYLVIDHVYPRAKGGDNSDENLQTLCFRCNCSKGKKTMYQFQLSAALKSLGRPISFYAPLARAVGMKEAVLLGQLIYWTPRSYDPGGWIYKSAAEVEEETSLTYKEQRRVRARLLELGLIEERTSRPEHRIYFRVNCAAVDLLMTVGPLSQEHLTDGQLPDGQMPTGAPDQREGEHLPNGQVAPAQRSVRYKETETTAETTGQGITASSKKHEIKELLSEYERQFVEKFHERPVIHHGKDAALAKNLIGLYGLEKVKAKLTAFFTSPDQFIRGSGYSFGLFHSMFNKLIVSESPPPTPAPKKQEQPWFGPPTQF